MTDKVQKIKDWISKEQDGLMDAQGNFEYPEHEGAYHILCNLDAYIDSIQEEPVSKVWHKGNEFDGVKYMRQYRWVIGNSENKRFAVGPCLEVEGGAIDILDGGGGIEMCVREEDSWAYLDDILNLTHSKVTKKSDQELTEFENRFGEILIPSWDITVGYEDCKGTVDDVKKYAAELLSIARKQFIEEACEWLRTTDIGTFPYKLIEEFRKAMSNETD